MTNDQPTERAARDELTNRSARAAYNSIRHCLEPHPPAWEDLPGWTRDQWRAVAQAGLGELTHVPRRDNCPDEFCPGWKDSGICPNNMRHDY